jgi:hypothetical protein
MAQPHSIEEARLAKERAKQLFRNLAPDGTITFGITRLDGGYGVKVNLQRDLSPGVELPGDVDGVPVKLEITGPARKL